MNDCLFCKIIRKEIPAIVIYEDAAVVAFLSISPVNPGHTLVVPKTHSENLYEATDDDLATVITASKKLAIAVKKASGATGINLINNSDASAGQTIFHTHFHLIPRFDGDGHQEWQGVTKPVEEMREIAMKIQSTLIK